MVNNPMQSESAVETMAAGIALLDTWRDDLDERANSGLCNGNPELVRAKTSAQLLYLVCREYIKRNAGPSFITSEYGTVVEAALTP
ncbi:hypothetical protein HDG34_000219 [Paraburkholderia sp. HC6.4b]|uniref:hypothetical protein n=1 Tax=unclassified Paraburkholderia TaxID=2615204 RepID=UPI001612D3BA|nr:MULTISPECIES: hypothetical protein [unclassified Paraburkholderia]MBB5406304.1 hypothetical protein [Paraburkholderia sp. HC6.4b]MBB5448701.1 hypothetical protein [Paraburkholderia sp. Kb1A]